MNNIVTISNWQNVGHQDGPDIPLDGGRKQDICTTNFKAYHILASDQNGCHIQLSVVSQSHNAIIIQKYAVCYQ